MEKAKPAKSPPAKSLPAKSLPAKSTPAKSTPARPVTINDIAALTGVAASTVSRALNNPGRVNAATRERIEAAARELHYVPNSQARALTSGRTGTIAVLVSDVTNPFYFGMIRGTQQQLKAAGYAQLLIDTEDSGELEERDAAQDAALAGRGDPGRVPAARSGRWPGWPARSRWSPSTATSAACRASSSTPRPASARRSST